MAFVLDQVLRSLGAATIAQAIAGSGLVWLGFAATALLPSVTYEQRPFRYFAINAGYRLVVIVVMGVILSLWK